MNIDEKKIVNSGEMELLFVKYIQKRFGFIWRSLVFTVAAVMLFGAALYLLVSPHSQTSLYLTILLEKRKEFFCYPNGSPFSSNDLLSTPVLMKVYTDLQLQKKIKFSSFQSAFFISQENFKASALDALYKAKLAQMSVRNLTAVSIKRLEEEYEKKSKLTVLPGIVICMDSRRELDDAMTMRILCAVPQAWFEIYSKLEAKTFPELDNTGMIRQLNQDIKKDYFFIPLQKSRQICQRLLKICKALNEMRRNKKIFLATGESLDDLVTQIQLLNEYQINSLALYVQSHAEYRNAMDYVFIVSEIQHYERKLLRLKAKYEAAQHAKNLVSMYSSSRSSGKNTDGSGMIVQLNNEFLDGLTALIRNDMSSKILMEYADKMLLLKDAIAEMEVDKAYYEQLLQGKYAAIESSYKIPKLSNINLKQEIVKAFQQLEKLNESLIALKEKIAVEYLTSREFFSSLNQVRKTTFYDQFWWNVFMGGTALLFLVWLLIIGWDFFQMHKNGKINE